MHEMTHAHATLFASLLAFRAPSVSPQSSNTMPPPVCSCRARDATRLVARQYSTANLKKPPSYFDDTCEVAWYVQLVAPCTFAPALGHLVHAALTRSLSILLGLVTQSYDHARSKQRMLALKVRVQAH